VNLHCCAAIANCQFFELLYPVSSMNIAMRQPIEIDAGGYAHPPKTPGHGVEWDWDFIDNCTVEIL
jgi:L-alanine-DL-glutamate epimerase-like enolase superfamily enzyme